MLRRSELRTPNRQFPDPAVDLFSRALSHPLNDLHPMLHTRGLGVVQARLHAMPHPDAARAAIVVVVVVVVVVFT